MHRSPYFGQSVEFRQHREYTLRRRPAPRRLEGLGQAGPLLRQAVRGRHEPPLHAAGRRFGQHALRPRAPMNKYEYGCTVAVSLAYLLLRQQDAVGCVAFDDAARATVPLRTRRNHLDSIIQALDVSEPRNKTDLYPYPPRSGRDLSAPRHDGADLRPAGRARGAVPRPEAAAQPRTRRAWCSTCWTTTSSISPSTAPRGSRAGSARATDAAIPGRCAKDIWRRCDAYLDEVRRGCASTASITPCCGPASRWTPRWPPI